MKNWISPTEPGSLRALLVRLIIGCGASRALASIDPKLLLLLKDALALRGGLEQDAFRTGSGGFAVLVVPGELLAGLDVAGGDHGLVVW